MTENSRVSGFLKSPKPWLTDGGLETTIIFHDGIDLPMFASFHLLENEQGLTALNRYFDRYITIAKEAGTWFVLDTATWRSGTAWGRELGRSKKRWKM